jgi:hypothetical protein
MTTKNHKIRHPGEGRDPVCDIAVDIRIKHWIPAFAGMTWYERLD